MKIKNISTMWKSEREQLHDPEVPVLELLHRRGRSKVRKNRLVSHYYLILFLAVQGVTFVLSLLNIHGYRGNVPWVSIHGAITGLSFLFLAYGVYLILLLRKLGRGSDDLVRTIKDYIRFNRVHYHVWLVMVALSCLMLTLAINGLIDNQDGHYQINNVKLFTGILVGMTVFIYVAIRAAHYPLQQELRVHLADLLAQTTESGDHLESRRKQRKWLVITLWLLLASLLLFLLILGIVIGN